MSQKNDKVQFFKDSLFKVAELIFSNPNKTFHIRLLEKETGLSTTAVADAVKKLGPVLSVEKTPLTTNIRADISSEEYRFSKIIFNLHKLHLCGVVEKLSRLFTIPEAIVLFGSYAKGEDIEESDIDLLVISKQEPKNLALAMLPIEKSTHRKLNIHVLPNLNKSSKEFRNAVANGIVLSGYIKVV